MNRLILLSFAAAFTIAASLVSVADDTPKDSPKSPRAADFPEGSPKFLTSYAAASAEAKKTGKPMVVVLSATWCAPCQVNKKKVYPSEEVKPFHDKFVWAYLDADKDENQKLLKEYGANGIPYIRFVSKDGKSLGSVEGQTKPADFAKKLAAALGQ